MSGEEREDRPDERDARKRREDEEDLEALCLKRPDLADDLKALFGHLSPAEGSDTDASRGLLSGRFRDLVGRLKDLSRSASRYEILDEIARGGMGTILRVRQGELDRDLAMKVMLGEEDVDSANPRVLSRFLEEALVTGKLDHPGVVPVHDLGIDEDGRAFFTMKLVKGRDLEKIFDLARRGEEGWAETRVVGVLLKACEALAYAHDKDVIHRDLKPANIMVGRFGEVYVMDWGLARARGMSEAPAGEAGDLAQALRTIRRDEAEEVPGSPLMTLEGDVVGTPAYMSPEQARGELDSLGPRSDIYSLGAILYHLLARRMPFVAADGSTPSAEVLRSLLAGPPLPLHEANPRVPAELAAICMKSMAREPAGRYQSMVELADDLRAYLEGRVVRAYETGAIAEFRKWFLRNRWLAGSLATALLLLVLGSLGYGWRQASLRREIQTQKEQAEESRKEAVAKREEALRAKLEADTVADFMFELFRSADPLVAGGDTVTAEDLLDQGAAAIASSLEEMPLARARLMLAMGTSYHSLGLFEKGFALVEGAHGIYQEGLGDDEVRTLEALYHLAAFYIPLGRYQEATPLFEQALEGLRRELGDDHETTLAAAINLGALYYSESRLQEAEPLFRLALEGCRRTLGEDDRQTLSVLVNLGTVMRAQGRFEEAEPLLMEAVDSHRLALGSDHPQTLGAILNLAALYYTMRAYEEAEPLFKEALEGYRERLGEKHPQFLTTLLNLGMNCRCRGRFDEAEPLLKQAFEGFRRNFGDRYPMTPSAECQLAGLYEEMGRLEEAEPLQLEALAALRSLHGDAHPETLASVHSLADLRKAQGRMEDAEALYQEALEGFRANSDAAGSAVLECMRDLCQLLEELQKLREAEALARDLVELSGEDDPQREEDLLRLSRIAELRAHEEH